MSASPHRLRETLGRPELSRFLQRLRRRLEEGQALTGTLTLTRCGPEERDALHRLLRRPPSGGGSLAIPLETLEHHLRQAGLCASLAQAVEYLTGPVTDRSAARREQARAWETLFNEARDTLASRPPLLAWLDQVEALGLLRRHSQDRAAGLLDQALKILSALPAPGLPLAELAASVLGDAHALDPGRPLSPLLLRAVSRLGGVERWDDSESRRDAWASVGVLLDELSAPVAVLNLRASGGDSTSRALNLHADTAEPYFLTIRQLVRTPPAFDPAHTGAIVHIFENKNILAAAANRLGPASPPLVATDGQPKTALHLLLQRLTAAGIRLRYHGDFDWPGLRIANAMITRHGTEIWRMTTSDYLAAVSGHLSLDGPPVEAAWDPSLRSVMQEKGIALHEEQVLDAILAALS